MREVGDGRELGKCPKTESLATGAPGPTTSAPRPVKRNELMYNQSITIALLQHMSSGLSSPILGALTEAV